jgi:hypothetical protein
MSYNVNAMNAYQQYGSSMAAGGGGTNMSGSSAMQGLGAKPSDAYTQYAETMTAGGGGQTMAGTGTSAYQQAQQMAGSDNDNSPAQLYTNSANAFTNSGVNLKDQTWTPSGDPRLLYNENKFKAEEIVTDVKDYLRGTAIEDALLEAQGFEAPRSALYTGENRPLTEQELQQYKPLFDLMDDSIEVEELSRMDREDQEALLEAIGVGNLGRMPQDTAFLGGDFDVATTNQQFIRDAVRAKQIAELKNMSKAFPDDASIQKDIQDLLNKIQGEENETAPVVRPEMYEDMSTPVSPTDTITDDADGGAAPSGKGLMSPDAGMLRPRARPSQATLAGKQYGTAVAEMAVDLEKTEGNVPHIGADWDNVTLALGIVPSSGLKIDGKKVPSDRAERGKWLKSNGYVDKNNQPTAKFKKAKIDTSNVSKDGINRKDYASDTEWSVAVINKFKSYGEEVVEDFDSLGVKEQKVIIDLAWNMGKGGLSYSGNEALINELKKPPEDRVIANMLEAGTHVYEGGRAMRGLARRKALTINEVIENPAEKISQIRQLSFGNDTYHTYINAKGEEVKTIKLKRKHIKSPDGVIDVATGDEILSQSDLDYSSIAPRPRSRPDTVVASN